MMNTAATSFGDGNGEEDTEDSSSTSNHLKSELDEFREKWQKELVNSQNKNADDSNEASNASPQDQWEINNEERARDYFMKGIEFEKCGKVYDALHCYRRATRLVPDIEFHVNNTDKTQQKTLERNNNIVANTIENKKTDNLYPEENCNEVNEDLNGVDLRVRFNYAIVKNGGRLIEKIKSDDDLIRTGGKGHISDLPMEIILYIMRWVVSSNLDVRSLEQCAAVCKGLYLCARDEEIWKSACLKVWGSNTGSLKKSAYLSWRQMFIERHRINFNGCYISKTTYLRYGENSFQDKFYRPVQLVNYYRYMRFLPDGTVLMLTSTEEPAQSVSKLKNINQRNDVRNDLLCGHYRLHGDLIILILKCTQKSQQLNKKKLTSSENADDCGGNNGNGKTKTFHIKLRISSTYKKLFCHLKWEHYAITQIENKRKLTTDLEITPTLYPPLWFSRVKSYHMESEMPLK